MLFMVVNRTKAGLAADDFARLAGLAKEFYGNIPQGIVLHNDWSALDGSHTYALLEAGNEQAIEALVAPFRPYVDIQIVAVREISGWEVS